MRYGPVPPFSSSSPHPVSRPSPPPPSRPPPPGLSRCNNPNLIPISRRPSHNLGLSSFGARRDGRQEETLLKKYRDLHLKQQQQQPPMPSSPQPLFEQREVPPRPSTEKKKPFPPPFPAKVPPPPLVSLPPFTSSREVKEDEVDPVSQMRSLLPSAELKTEPPSDGNGNAYQVRTTLAGEAFIGRGPDEAEAKEKCCRKVVRFYRMYWLPEEGRFLAPHERKKTGAQAPPPPVAARAGEPTPFPYHAGPLGTTRGAQVGAKKRQQQQQRFRHADEESGDSRGNSYYYIGGGWEDPNNNYNNYYGESDPRRRRGGRGSRSSNNGSSSRSRWVEAGVGGGPSVNNGFVDDEEAILTGGANSGDQEGRFPGIRCLWHIQFFLLLLCTGGTVVKFCLPTVVVTSEDNDEEFVEFIEEKLKPNVPIKNAVMMLNELFPPPKVW